MYKRQNDISVMIIAGFCMAMIRDTPTNSKHKIRVNRRELLSCIFLQKNPFTRSMEMAELDVRTIDASVDIEADNTSTRITLKMTCVAAPPLKAWTRTDGIMAS